MSRGFTLIELMIVVVIIGVLAAIAIPKFSNVQDLARQSSCRGNIRTIATAEAVYFPAYGCFTSDITHLDIVQGNASTVRCPSDPHGGAYVVVVPSESDYSIICPNNAVVAHGSIASGISSWQGSD